MKVLSPDHPNLIDCYNQIGLIFSDMSENVKASQIAEKILPPNQSVLANLYNNIAMIYINNGNNSKAFPYFEEVYEIN